MTLLVLDDTLLHFTQLKTSFINQNDTFFYPGKMLPSKVVFTSNRASLAKGLRRCSCYTNWICFHFLMGRFFFQPCWRSATPATSCWTRPTCRNCFIFPTPTVVCIQWSTFLKSDLKGPRGHSVMDRSSACGANLPGFESCDIQMFFLPLAMRWKKEIEPAVMKLLDLALSC